MPHLLVRSHAQIRYSNAPATREEDAGVMGGKCDSRSDLLGGARRHDEGLKVTPERPPEVCRMDGKTRGASIVTDLFEKAQRTCVFADEKLLYIIDAGLTHGRNISVYAV
jgi:hypothetical protein